MSGQGNFNFAHMMYYQHLAKEVTKLLQIRLYCPVLQKKVLTDVPLSMWGSRNNLLKRLDIVISLLLSFIVEHSLQTKVVLEPFYVQNDMQCKQMLHSCLQSLHLRC